MKTQPIKAVSASRSSRGNEAHTLKKSEPPSAFAKLRCDKHVGGYGFERDSIELSIATESGQFVARYSEKGLAALDFPRVGTPRCGVRTSQRDVPTKVRRWHRATVAALKNVLTGRSPGKFPPFDLSGGTMFQRKVWNMLQKIACGRTKSYGEIARAVGGACGANPIPIFVPCHRVLAANKKLGSFSGGLNWKLSLLAREGVMFR